MGHSELLLTLGAIAIFGMVLLTTNRRMIEQNDNMIQREFEYYAISAAQTFIEEAKTKWFDENVILASPDSSGFTSYSTLGPEGETYANFNDVDDYHGYSAAVIDTTARDSFFVNITVGYVSETDPETQLTAEAYYKKMTVTITNRYLDAPVSLRYVFGYLQN
ncbi:MAG: hypothetical protein O7G31_14735 [Calditrichaeota bacterium]|nr:hypothetical protein [Calditrichota bacterium]